MSKLNTISYVTLILALCIMSVFGYWLFYPYNVLTHVQQPTTLKTAYQAGDRLEWKVDVIHHTKDVPVTVVRQLQNDFYVNLPNAGYITTGEHQQFINSIMLPNFLPTGKYKLSLTSIFHVNPVRDIIISTTTNEFTVK